MVRHARAAVTVIALVVSTIALVHAATQPKVALTLTAEPSGRIVKAGETIKYSILATNSGDAPAYRLAPVGKIPARTQFVRIDGAPKEAAAEFTLDGASWSAQPTIARKNAAGKLVRVPAPLGAYRAVRWTLKRALAAHQSATFTYEVRVK